VEVQAATALSAANLAAERGQTAMEELNRLIVEAEGREAAAAIDARKDGHAGVCCS